MKVVFHFGPPKSGTSAIQKWMSSNRQWLLSQKIYYPDHGLDVNGVSSGNLRKIFVESNGELELSDSHLKSEIEKAKRVNCHTIIFSSEFFFRKLESIAEKVPEAQFIGYVRFGLEMMQSSYNQAVKRHGKTLPFRQTKHLQSTLRALGESIDKIGEDRFLLHPYSKKLFKAENIVADFLSALNVDYTQIDTSIGRVNSSYCIECIEIKRWFNQLESEALQTQLDLALQSYGDSTPFSLFSDNSFEKNKNAYLKQLKLFLSTHKVVNAEAFYDECARQPNKPYKKQELSVSEFKRVLKELLGQRKLSRRTIYQAYCEALSRKDSLTQPERISVLSQLTPNWLKVFQKMKHIFGVSN